jgi:GMP synthase-like glutamine amidotransferase
MEPAMRIHSLQHVPFEDIGSMLQDLQAQGHSLSTTHWYKGDPAPALDSFDLLIVMGGPMGVYDDVEYPWLTTEKQLIGAAIAAGKKMLGVCLGAQLIACVLGAQVSRNPHREIGWFPLEINTDAKAHPIATILADCPHVFHWHGDTFELPDQAQLLASSQACVNQAYVIDNRIYGFQFHLETTKASASALIQHCAGDLDNSRYVQSAETIMDREEDFTAINRAMSRVFLEITRS